MLACATLCTDVALADAQRPYRVEDSIGYADFGGLFGYPVGTAASNSGDRVAVYVTRADAAANTNVPSRDTHPFDEPKAVGAIRLSEERSSVWK